MSKRWVPVLVVAALSMSAAARAEKPSVAIAPVTGDRATDDLRSRVAKSLADGLVAAGAEVAPTGSAAYVLRGTLEVEGRSYALRLEMLDGRTGAVLATREDRCEICTETEALETWNTAASTLKARVIKRPEGAAAAAPQPVAAAPGATVTLVAPPPTPTAAVQLDASAESPRPRHGALGWTAIGAGAVGIGLGTFWASYDWKRTCNAPEPETCPEGYHNNKWYGGAVAAAGVALVGVGILALLGKL